MRFQSSIGLHKFKVTCRIAQNILVPGPRGVETHRTEPLIAKFEWENGYLFDSVKAQKKYNWSDEERQFVEEYLLDPDRNRYLNKSDLRKTIYCLDIVEEHNAMLKAKGEQAKEAEPKRPCLGWDVEANAACTEDAIEGIDYCKRHVPILEST